MYVTHEWNLEEVDMSTYVANRNIESLKRSVYEIKEFEVLLRLEYKVMRVLENIANFCLDVYGMIIVMFSEEMSLFKCFDLVKPSIVRDKWKMDLTPMGASWTWC